MESPGWKTTEFWLSLLAMVVGALLASGAFPSAGVVGQVLGFASTILASLGYTYSRTSLKNTSTKADAMSAVAASNAAALTKGAVPSAPVPLSQVPRSS